MEETINEHKQTEEKLRESEKELKAIFNSIRDGVAIIDVTGKTIKINKRIVEVGGYSEEEIIGKRLKFLKMFPPRSIAIMVYNFTKLISGRQPPPFNVEVYTKAGEKLDVELHGSPLKKQGKTVGMVGVMRDITERKKAEEKIAQQNIQLKKLDKIKTDFLNVTSHELRTPMASIKGYIQMLLKQKLGEITEEQRKALNVVLRNTDRLDHLIQDILDISRLESRMMKFVPKKTDVRPLIGETVETMQSYADLKHIKIRSEVEDKIPELIIDQERIKQVIINLLNNAIKFSPDGSIINIRAKKEKDDILFEVQDFGRGIPKNKQMKIFETFYQVDSSKDKKFGGVGLGLSISRGIVVSHGGKIWVESKEGKGSMFRFILPIDAVVNMEEKFKGLDIFGLENK